MFSQVVSTCLLCRQHTEIIEEKNDRREKISEYLEVLSSKAPVPGGGGASALAGALGNALGQMVVNLTVGKKNTQK